MALEIHFLFFPELFTSQFGHVYSACPSVHVCLHAHTLTLLCQGLMIPKEFPCYILSFNGARITRYCLSYGVSHITVTSPIFLIEQDTTAPVFSHFHPDGNSLPMKPPVLISRHCSRLRLPSQGSAGTLMPASSARVLAAGGTFPLMG